MTLSPCATLRARVLRVLLLILSLGLYPVALSAATLTPQQERGKQIYFSGRDVNGDPIPAYFGFGGELLTISATTSNCASCHGYDGSGRPESGVVPANITWKYLAKAYGGQKHPPFNEESLKWFLLYGDYPGGGTADPSMPLYDLSDQALDDLVAFLKVLGEVAVPGVSDDTIRIGTLLAEEGPLAGMAASMRGVMRAYFSKINQRGGLYGRKLELVIYPGSQEKADAASIMSWIDRQEPFALLGAFLPGAEIELYSALYEKDISLIGPFSLFTQSSYSDNRNIFYLYPGLSEQLRALLRAVDKRIDTSSPRVALLYPQGHGLDRVIEDTARAVEKRGWRMVQKMPFFSGNLDAVAVANRLEGQRIDVLIFLGVEYDGLSLLQEAADRKWLPHVLMPGALAGALAVNAPQAFASRLWLAYPTLPGDRQSWAVRELFSLLPREQFSPTHIQSAISAYSAANVLVEALRKAGKDLDRRKLVSALESFYQLETGLTPPISYSRNRRIGANGAHVICFNPLAGGNKKPSTWVELDETDQ